MNIEFNIIDLATNVSFGILALAMVLAFVRLILGPTMPDRVLALDLIASISIGSAITLMFVSGQPFYLDIAIFIALIVFIGTVAISKYLKQQFNDE